MKAHYDGLTCRQKKIITDVAVRTATRLADQQKEAIAIRSQYLVFVAMLECGLLCSRRPSRCRPSPA